MKHNHAGHSLIGLLIFISIIAAPTLITFIVNFVANGVIG